MPIGEPSSGTCLLTRNADQAVANATFVPINWNVELQDLGNWHATGAPERITPHFYPFAPPGGQVFLATLFVRFSADATGVRRARILKTSGATTTVVADSVAGAATLSTGPLNLAVTVQLFNDDYVYADVWQNSGAGLVLDATTTMPTFSLTPIG